MAATKQSGGDRRFDYLKDALRYGDELTPEQNRRRINSIRSGVVNRSGSRSSLAGDHHNAGISQKLSAERRYELGGRQP